MLTRKLKIKLAGMLVIAAFFATVSVSQAGLCGWDDTNYVCSPTATDGICAVAEPACDGPVVE
ncbi:hypothetical protein [Algoriphagus sp.]|uniref:hypothetical protein n=1 Tax=Algoriphagus sp. TaxID=1872435 RepID=UPI003F714893